MKEEKTTYQHSLNTYNICTDLNSDHKTILK